MDGNTRVRVGKQDVSYSGRPFRRMSSAAVSANPVIVGGWSRLQLLRQLPNNAQRMQVSVLRLSSVWSAASSAMSLAFLKSSILGMRALLCFFFQPLIKVFMPFPSWRVTALVFVGDVGGGVPLSERLWTTMVYYSRCTLFWYYTLQHQEQHW